MWHDSLWTPGLDLKPVHAGFAVKIAAAVQGFLLAVQFIPVSIIPPVLRIHSFIHIAPALQSVLSLVIDSIVK
jgi:hypothetical protein